MRIAYVTETWLPSVDGIVTRLAATIGELHRDGHEILVIAPRGKDMRLPGATVRAVPTIGFRWLYGGKRWGLPVHRVSRYLREFDPDVVHVVNPVLLGIAGVVAARRQRRTLVASYHTDLARYLAHYRLGWAIPLLWTLLRRLHGVAHVNLATSASAAGQLARHGIGDVALWPRGVDLELYRPTEQAPERSCGRPPVALYVGRLAAEKGLHRLAPLTAPGSGVRLVLVGDGPARPDLRHCFGSEVTVTGTLRGRSLAQTYRDADVFVFPSTTDTLGLVLLEALASGLPVVAADSPASRESLAGCPAARLFPADQPQRLPALIGELLASAPRDTLARQACTHAGQWSWTQATATLLEHYRSASSQAAPTATANGPRHRR